VLSAVVCVSRSATSATIVSSNYIDIFSCVSCAYGLTSIPSCESAPVVDKDFHASLANFTCRLFHSALVVVSTLSFHRNLFEPVMQSTSRAGMSCSSFSHLLFFSSIFCLRTLFVMVFFGVVVSPCFVAIISICSLRCFWHGLGLSLSFVFSRMSSFLTFVFASLLLCNILYLSSHCIPSPRITTKSLSSQIARTFPFVNPTNLIQSQVAARSVSPTLPQNS